MHESARRLRTKYGAAADGQIGAVAALVHTPHAIDAASVAQSEGRVPVELDLWWAVTARQGVVSDLILAGGECAREVRWRWLRVGAACVEHRSVPCRTDGHRVGIYAQAPGGVSNGAGTTELVVGVGGVARELIGHALHVTRRRTHIAQAEAIRIERA